MSEVKSVTSGDGRGTITFDAKAGLLVNGVVTGAGLAVTSWLSSLDFSTLPHFVAVIAPVGVGVVVGWVTTKVLPRFKTA